MLTFGEVLTSLIRRHTTHSINGFAMDIGFPKTMVYHWVNNKHFPAMDKLILMAEYFADVSGTSFTSIYAMFCCSHPLAQQVHARGSK